MAQPRSPLLRLAWFGLCLVAALATPAEAAGIDAGAKARAIVDAFVVPRVEALSAAAATQRSDWVAFCAGPRRAEGLGLLRRDFEAVALAWAGVEAVRIGPVAADTRYERIAHWPERRNATAKGLAALLAGKGTAGLSPQEIRAASVAVQGLSALERVIYEPADGAALVGADPAAERRCAVGVAIASALATVSREVLVGWTEGPEPARVRLTAPGEAHETLVRTATDAITLLRQVMEAKIAVPLGKSAEDAKPALAEYARAGLTNRAIAADLAAVEALAAVVLDPDAEGSAATLAALRSARSIAETMAAPIGTLAQDPKARSRVVLLRSAAQSALELAAETIPAALGIAIGFNSLDGD